MKRQIKYSDKLNRLLGYFDKIVDQVTDISSIESIILTSIKSEEFASFSEEEQNALLMMLAVYQDSANYWEENFDEWKELLGENEANGDLRADIIVARNEAEIDEALKKNGWKADGAGALGGLLGGAFFGSALGPAGTVVGAVGGAIEGAIVGSVMNLLLPTSTVVRFNSIGSQIPISSQGIITSINQIR